MSYSNEYLNGDGLKKVFELLKDNIGNLNLSIRKNSEETDANKALDTDCTYSCLTMNLPENGSYGILYNMELYRSDGGDAHYIIQKWCNISANREIWERVVLISDSTHPEILPDFYEWRRIDNVRGELPIINASGKDVDTLVDDGIYTSCHINPSEKTPYFVHDVNDMPNDYYTVYVKKSTNTYQSDSEFYLIEQTAYLESSPTRIFKRLCQYSVRNGMVVGGNFQGGLYTWNEITNQYNGGGDTDIETLTSGEIDNILDNIFN